VLPATPGGLPGDDGRLLVFALDELKLQSNGGKGLTLMDVDAKAPLVSVALPQGRRLPMGLPGPHPRPRIHPPDRAGRYDDAYMVNWVSNVFPGILGRTCDRPCEPACRRGRVEEKTCRQKPEPVAICRLKRVAADFKGDVVRAHAQGRPRRTASAWPASAPARPR
jgi:hypothetical protein